jgi:hypothetical protein
MPPKTAWMLNGVAWPRNLASSAICTTSSRVGAMTSARGAAGRPGRSRRSSRVKIVMRKAAVFPVPVCAWPATSRPASERGSTFSWIGVQCVKPADSMPAITGAGRSKLVKVRAVSGGCTAARDGSPASGFTAATLPAAAGGVKATRQATRQAPRIRSVGSISSQQAAATT